MKTKNWHYWLLVLIAALTALTGLVQCLWPGFVLRTLSAEITGTTKHFFGIVGMFMVLFGGALLHALFRAGHHPVVVLWAGLQKFGAAVAVGLGVQKALFTQIALLVAGFDLLSGLLILWYWFIIRRGG